MRKLIFVCLAACGAPGIEHDDRVEMLAALDRGEPQDVVVVLNGAPSREVSEDALFQGASIPVLGMRVKSREALSVLESRSDVVHVEPNRIHEMSASASLELIGQPTAFGRGATGAGTSVAVLDTGLDYTREEFGSCTGVGSPSACAVPFVKDFAPNDGTLDDNVRHGTNVAAIVRSVAPQAKVIGLDVFNGSGGSTLDIIAAVDWVIQNRATYNIVAANFSLGYGAFTSPCANDALAVALQRLRDAGVLPVVATGNASKTNAISSPACGPASVSVGAVSSAGIVASFSNSASFMTLLAPGVGISAGGVTMSGTSQATPHVAGAVAALRSLYPGESPDAIVQRLRGTGVSTLDTRNNLTTPRLDVAAASVKTDAEPPTGTLTLPTITKTASVAYDLSSSDAATMCMTTAAKCTSFVAFVAHGTFALPAGEGKKTVRVWLKDAQNNMTAQPIEASTVLDTKAAKDGKLTLTRGVLQTTLSWTAAVDASSAVKRYRAVYSTDKLAPASCAVGTLLGETAQLTLPHTGLTSGTTYRYRVCSIDAAENMSVGVTADNMAVPETDPPQNALVRIGDGAAWTKAAAVTLSLTASDASGVTSMCVSATTTCTAWRAYAPTISVNLSSGVGERRVYAWFKDTWGNAMTTPVSAMVQIDSLPPPNPVVTATVASKSISLSFPAVIEPAGSSGVADYLVASSAGRIPASCTGGQVVSTSLRTIQLSATSATGWRVCARDRLGNVSAGKTGTTTPLP